LVYHFVIKDTALEQPGERDGLKQGMGRALVVSSNLGAHQISRVPKFLWRLAERLKW
jgi:hypothetical protein